MKAFHNDSEVKTKYLRRVKLHALADEIVKGQYWENGKGCAVGCTIHSSDHLAYEIELGIPEILAHLEDRIFENLPNDLAKTWPERFLESIKVGADLSLVWDKFASRLLTDPVIGVIQYAKTDGLIEVIQRVSDLYEARIAGLEVDKQDFKDAAADADEAADEAADADEADADEAAYAAYAAYAAAGEAANATSYAAAAAGEAARTKAYIGQSELLIELLREAK